jgi:prepilin-type N-terminal cleavage/methylation domain-containing protein
MSGERGFTMIELMVGITVSLVMLGAIMSIVQVATRSQDRVAERVAANQRARPAMTRIIDRLHSACISPGIAPIQKDSSDTTMIFYSKSGASVSPIPDRYVVSLSGDDLIESRYAATTTSPPWTFNASPADTDTLVEGITTGNINNPATSVPIFRYYAYEGGAVSEKPLTTPLSSTDAARAVQVQVAFTTAPSAKYNDAYDSSLMLTDSATLRIEPASEDSAEVNRPCV